MSHQVALSELEQTLSYSKFLVTPSENKMIESYLCVKPVAMVFFPLIALLFW